jgi:multidrug efflux pump subunit AcrA (membrane-fusion protein)
MSLMKKMVVTGVLVLLALPLVVKAEISPPETVVAVLEQVNEYQILDGQIEVVNKSTVSAQTAGIISKLNYDVGDTVKKGSLIARISSQTQKSGVLEAKASVNQSKATISAANATISGALASMKEAEATIARASATIAQAKAATKEAQANYAAARAEFERVKGLYAKRILTKSQYDQAEAAMRSTLARVESAKAQQKSAEAERVAAVSRLSSAKAALASAKANLASAKAMLNSSKANLSKAGEQLGYTEILAPYSGIVTERHVELGEVVSPGKPIMTGISLGQMRVVANIPQRLIMKVRKYNSARLFVDGDKTGRPIKKLTIFPYADPATNAFKVRASLDSAVKGLFPGVFVKIGFEVGEEEHLVIPVSAVAYRSEVTAVYVIDNEGRPSMRQIRLGRTTPDGKIRVLAGLSVGEKIAIDPVHAAVYLKHLRQQQVAKSGDAHE